MPRFHILLRTVIFSSVLLAMVSASGLLAAQETDFQFPSNPLNWLNSPPISKETLTGKAAVLYFFEES